MVGPLVAVSVSEEGPHRNGGRHPPGHRVPLIGRGTCTAACDPRGVLRAKLPYRLPLLPGVRKITWR